MVWRVTDVKEQRKLFIKEYQKGEITLSDICERYNISRPTGYKWIKRYMLEGEHGLEDRSKERLTQAHKTNKRLENRILEIKREYERWGPKKIYGFLNKNEPDEAWPSMTTFGNILKRHGLVTPRKIRRRFPSKVDPLSHCEQPNDVWCVDFKGWFYTKDRVKCDPFTVTDAYSRFILHCSKLHSGKAPDVWKTIDGLFYENGLPRYLRHDNGPPFATSGAGRLSPLSINLIKAGVIPEWIDPGKPHQNGRHERMHLTLKQEGAFPLKLTLEEQQMKFKEFIRYFNFIRPHEALNQDVPGDIYICSDRSWDGKLRSPEYDNGYLVKRVLTRGQVSWKGKNLFIGKALRNEHIGFKESDDGEWLAYYGPVLLGTVDHFGNFTIPRIRNRSKGNYTERCY